MCLLFSDLHLSAKTLETCLAVLRFVHAEAKKRNCPVYFLGDFFDTVYNKGTLPVDILNTLLRFFSTEWKVPLFMLVGNHDMFDAAETEHGLSFLPHTNPLIRVIDTPTRIGGELWVPWRRSVETVSQILSEHHDADVIFGHFDIIGFKMSHTRLSTEGVDQKLFPKDVPVYSGHYHTPQTHGNIQYIGSPYQLTLSEAEDQKQLLILNENYRITETIPLDIGRKQYKWTPSELINRASILRKNDRVAICITEPDGVLTKLVEQLQAQGVEITVKQTLRPVTTRIEDVASMTPVELFEEYGKRHALDSTSEACQETRDWLSKQHQTVEQTVRPVVPERITIEGFGPFVGPVTLPVTSGGLTLVSGQNDAADSSNGAGKSLVTAGAWLWAMTGVTDGRAALIFGNDNTSVVNAHVGKATVSVSGIVNRVPWSVCRTLEMSPRRKHELSVSVNGVDVTKATLAATQLTITTHIFGLPYTSPTDLCAWLLRNSVWSQAAVSRWLDASETQAKNDIKNIANVNIWEELSHWAKCQLKESKATHSTTTSSYSVQEHLLENVEERLLHNEKQQEQWNDTQLRLVATSREELALAQLRQEELVLEELTPPQQQSAESIQQATVLKTLLHNLQEKHIRQTVLLEKMTREISPVCHQLAPDELSEQIVQAQSLHIPETDLLKDASDQAFSALISRKEQLTQAKQTVQAFVKAGECQTCRRTFGDPEQQQQQHRRLQQRLQNSQEAYNNAQQQHRDLQKNYRDAVQRTETQENHVAELHLTQTYRSLKIAQDELQCTLNTANEKYESHNSALALAKARLSVYHRTKALREQAQQNFRDKEQLHQRLEAQKCPQLTNLVQLRTERTTRQRELALLDTQLDQTHADIAKWTAIGGWAGSRGIPTYAMERTVQQLAAYNTKWLQIFFRNKDISLEVSFDEKERLQRHLKWPGHAGLLSGGQWRRAQLASFMAWREMTPYQFPFIIMDEACTSMDGEGIEAVLRAFREWCDEDSTRTCFFITHEPGQHRDTSIYDDCLTIHNKRGRAAVVEQSQKRPKITA